MAQRLGVSPSMLLAIENGSRKPPAHWLNDFYRHYPMTSEQSERFENLMAERIEVFPIPTKNLSKDDFWLVWDMTQILSRMDDDVRALCNKFVDTYYDLKTKDDANENQSQT
jgi:hypothetical protein